MLALGLAAPGRAGAADGESPTLARAIEEARRALEDKIPWKEQILAAESLERALAGESGSVEADRLLGRLRVKVGPARHAAELLEQLVARHPEDWAIRVDLGRSYARLSEYRKAVAALQGVIDRSPEHLEAYVELADLLEHRLTAKRLAAETMDRMVAANPNSWVAHAYRCRFRRSQGDLKGAAEDVQAALTGNLAILFGKPDLVVLLEIGRMALELKSWELAERCVERGQACYPHDPAVVQLAADLAWLRGERGKAVQDLRAAIEKRPCDVELWRKYVSFQMTSDDLAKAQAAVEEIARRGCRPAWTEYLKAEVLIAQKKWADAYHVLRVLLISTDEDPELRLAVLYPLERCCRQLDRTEDLVAMLRPLADAEPRSSPIQMAYWNALDLAGREKEAIRQLHKFSRLVVEPDIALQRDKAVYGLIDMVAEEIEKPVRDTSPLLKRLRECIEQERRGDGHSATILEARVAIAQGDPGRAARLLASLSSDSWRDYPAGRILLAARLWVRLGREDAARDLLALYAERDPQIQPDLATILGKTNTLDDAMQQCETAAEVLPAQVVFPVAASVIASRSREAREEHFQKAEAWGREAVNSSPKSLHTLSRWASFQQAAGKSDEAIRGYRDCLRLAGLTPRQKAVIRNNLAYLLAVTSERPDEAVRFADDAVQTLGPIAAVLDTRALAYLAAGKADAAIRDLDRAVAAEPSALRFFHLALAHKAKENRQAAAAALVKARRDQSFSPDDLPKAERGWHRELVEWLGEN